MSENPLRLYMKGMLKRFRNPGAAFRFGNLFNRTGADRGNPVNKEPVLPHAEPFAVFYPNEGTAGSTFSYMLIDWESGLHFNAASGYLKVVLAGIDRFNLEESYYYDGTTVAFEPIYMKAEFWNEAEKTLILPVGNVEAGMTYTIVFASPVLTAKPGFHGSHIFLHPDGEGTGQTNGKGCTFWLRILDRNSG